MEIRGAGEMRVSFKMGMRMCVRSVVGEWSLDYSALNKIFFLRLWRREVLFRVRCRDFYIEV